MKLKRILALVLACVMCMSFLASCNQNGNNNSVGTRPPSRPGTDDSGYAQADFGGDQFTFLVIRQATNGRDYYGGNYIDADGYTGNKINDGVMNRNMAVEKKYNIEITQDVQDNEPAPLLRQKIFAGEFTYDVVYGWGYKMGACITENYFRDLNELENVDYTKEYWTPSTIPDLTIEGKQYLTQNEISMNKIDWAGFVFYNKSLAENLNIESEFGSPYDLVDSGKWTYDIYFKMIEAASSDTDGDGSITRNDIFGLLDGGGTGSGAFHHSGRFYTTTIPEDEGGGYLLNIYDQPAHDMMTKMYEVYQNEDLVKDYSDIWGESGFSADGHDDQWAAARSYFATDHALFCAGAANITSETAFRNMESEYGILPDPKVNETQESYVTLINSLASIFAIPSTYRDDDFGQGSPEKTGTILEYMAYQSSIELLPNYYEEVLKGQRISNERDQANLDLVRSNVRYEFTSIMGLEDIGATVDAMFLKPATAASKYKQDANKLQKQLDEFYTKVMLLD